MSRLNCVLGIQKKRLIETVLLSTHNNVLVEKYENYFLTNGSFVSGSLASSSAGPFIFVSPVSICLFQ